MVRYWERFWKRTSTEPGKGERQVGAEGARFHHSCLVVKKDGSMVLCWLRCRNLMLIPSTCLCWHDIIMQICQLWSHHANLPFHSIPTACHWIEISWLWKQLEYSELTALFKKPVWDYLSFEIWSVVLLEASIRRQVHWREGHVAGCVIYVIDKFCSFQQKQNSSDQKIFFQSLFVQVWCKL